VFERRGPVNFRLGRSEFCENVFLSTKAHFFSIDNNSVTNFGLFLDLNILLKILHYQMNSKIRLENVFPY
jgi:hypothetical protein